MLGVLYAALGAFTFALNNVAMRRGVVTGSVLQGMALTVPIGGLSFLVMTIAFGELHQLLVFPMAALTWSACQGVVHFVIGRYCNYKSNQLMGVNLTAPVVQLQVPIAMLLAVVMLHERFTVLQAVGSALMLGGSFITQGNAGKGRRKASGPLTTATSIPTVPSQKELAQLAEGDGHDQEGNPADRHGQRHALQHAARHHPPAHRHVVERKGERAQSSVKDTEQGTSPEDLLFRSLVYNVIASWPFQPQDRATCPTRRPRIASCVGVDRDAHTLQANRAGLHVDRHGKEWRGTRRVRFGCAP